MQDHRPACYDVENEARGSSCRVWWRIRVAAGRGGRRSGRRCRRRRRLVLAHETARHAQRGQARQGTWRHRRRIRISPPVLAQRQLQQPLLELAARWRRRGRRPATATANVTKATQATAAFHCAERAVRRRYAGTRGPHRPALRGQHLGLCRHDTEPVRQLAACAVTCARRPAAHRTWHLLRLGRRTGGNCDGQRQ